MYFKESRKSEVISGKNILKTIYEYIKPQTLEEMKEYIKCITNNIPITKEHIRATSDYLIFDSYFECANLQKVYALSYLEYDLYVNSDIEGSNYSQWFYFSVTNAKSNSCVKFNVMNIRKHLQFIKDGMKPLVYSKIEAAWNNRTENIQLTKCSDNTECYTLSFTYTFLHDNDEIYFALWKPYSYSKLKAFIQDTEDALLQESKVKSLKNEEMCEIRTADVNYRRTQLCISLGGLPIDLLTITANTTEKQNKTYIIITARAHASETAGSYKAEGIVKFLTSKATIATLLRQKHIFLIIPTLNPDGTVLGHNRCDINGADLNRCWDNPKEDLHPAIFNLKGIMKELINKGREISLYCDLHGHSQTLNSFIFACHVILNKKPTLWTRVKVFTRIFADKCSIVKYSQCQYNVKASKVFVELMYRYIQEEL